MAVTVGSPPASDATSGAGDDMRFHEHVNAITVPTTTSASVHGGESLLLGWSLRETTGSAGATVEVYDGGDTTGQLLTTISLSANESTRDFLSVGIESTRGLYVSIVSGTIKGVLWARLRRQPATT